MAAFGDLLSPIRRVANLSLIAGFGRLGERVATELGRLLPQTGEAQSRAVAVWNASQPKEDIRAAALTLLSAPNLDWLEQLGYQIPKRLAGQPLCANLVCVIDGGETGGENRLSEVF